MSIAIITILTILAILSILQIALVFGAPIGHFAWGGQHRVLPRNLRIGSLFSVAIYSGIVACILSKSGVYQIIPEGLLLDILVWIIFAYFALGVFMNAISRSKPERYTMTPTSLVLAICIFAVAIG
jgi:hypothetical protein